MICDNELEKLDDKDLEALENKYLEKYYHFLKFSMDNIILGLKSKEKIKDDWFDIWNNDSVTNQKQGFSVGAERVIYYYLSNSRILGDPNSNPVSSDLMFETEDAFIHIDLKTVQTTNIGDIKSNIFIGNNQNSYDTQLFIKNTETPLKYKGNLPKYYTLENCGKPCKKPCLTYFITILHDNDTLDNLMIAILSMPNGQLESLYGSSVISAGKKKNDKDRGNGRLSTARFNFSKHKKFRLLPDKCRIKVAYLHPSIVNGEIYKKELEHFILTND